MLFKYFKDHTVHLFSYVLKHFQFVNCNYCNNNIDVLVHKRAFYLLMHVLKSQRFKSGVYWKRLKMNVCHVQWLMFNIRELLCTYVLCVFTLSIFHSTLISLRVTQVHKLLIFDFHFCRNSSPRHDLL